MKKFLSILTYLIPTFFVFSFVLITHAATYTPLEPIDGLIAAGPSTPNLTQYLNNLYTFLISISVVAAVVMITIGGFTYLTSAASGEKSAGKQMIQNAIFGLLLMLGSYLIVYTINPDALSFNFFRNAKNLPVTKAPVVNLQESPEARPQGEVNDGTYNIFYNYSYQGGEKKENLATKKLCEDRKKYLEDVPASKYDVSRATCDDKSDASSTYYFGYRYYSTPDPSYTVFGSKEREIDAEKITVIGKKQCEQRITETKNISQVNKPYKAITACEASWFKKLYSYKFTMQTGSSNKTYTSNAFDTEDECILNREKISKVVEPYLGVDSVCALAAEQKDTGSISFSCINNAIENTPSGGKAYTGTPAGTLCFPDKDKCEKEIDKLREETTKAFINIQCLPN